MRFPSLALLTPTLAAPLAQATPAEYGEAMFRLATERGCPACHALEAGPRRSDGLPPIAPAWVEIAKRYRDDPVASERLTRTVMAARMPPRATGPARSARPTCRPTRAW